MCLQSCGWFGMGKVVGGGKVQRDKWGSSEQGQRARQEYYVPCAAVGVRS